jgi:hypothetical protein
MEHELPPTCAIPTTAGTGSEATKVSIITNTNTGVKMLLNDPKLMAHIAVVDPIFTLTVPPGVTAATGVDALTHAIEAYTSLKAFSMSDIYALSAVKRIFDNIYEVYTNGSNVSQKRNGDRRAGKMVSVFQQRVRSFVHGCESAVRSFVTWASRTVERYASERSASTTCSLGAVARLKQIAMASRAFTAGLEPRTRARMLL